MPRGVAVPYMEVKGDSLSQTLTMVNVLCC